MRRTDNGQPDEKVMVILDNHSSRNLIDKDKLWNDHGIKCFFIPPHSSHLVQPLDRTVNGTFKSVLGKSFQVIQKEEMKQYRNRLLKFASRAVAESHVWSVIEKGWAKSGLYPYVGMEFANSDSVLASIPLSNDEVQKINKQKTVRLEKGSIVDGKKILKNPRTN